MAEMARLGWILRLVPTAALVSATWALAWLTGGSFDAADWLGYAVGCTLVLASVLLPGAATLPSRWALAATGFLLALALWTAISLRWSPFPSLARDEALLVGFYAVAFLIPIVSLRREHERLAATALVVGGLGSLAVAGALELRFSSNPENLTWADGRLAFPVSYPNALAAMLLVGFWPAIGLAADRRLPALGRALLLGGAAAMLADLLLAQSKGGAVGLVVSGIVFFAVCPFRLRALVPVGIAAAVVATQAESLTEPYRASSDEFTSVIQHGGAVAAVVAALTGAVGLVYAVLDRQVEVSERVRRVAAVLVALAVVAGIGGGIGAFFTAVDRPGDFLGDQWRSFKHLPEKRRSTHFFSLGSNRYDFWRVALHEFEHHPVAGIGARGFANAYLVEGRSSETPERSHSLEMDVLSETGIVGIVLLLSAGALLFVATWPWVRRSVVGAGILGAGVYFAVHTGVDWVWTIPEVGLPAFALLGIGASRGDGGTLTARAAVPAGAVALALALLAFAPPWLSGRFVDRAYTAGTASRTADDLRWARRLDPLSTDPLVAEAVLARPPADIAPLERAVAKEPRRADLHDLLGNAYLAAGRKAAARREFRAALRLYPGSELARQGLARAR